jgi:hypothetical protein
MSVYQTTVNGITWNYTVYGSNASIGTPSASQATALGTAQSGELTIPGSLGVYTITGIRGSSFQNYINLQSISIPNSVTSIDSDAFKSCSGLTLVNLPNALITLGPRAFEACAKLRTIVLPNGLTTIGDTAFVNCTAITSVTIPNTVTSIGTHVYANCTNLTSLTIGTGLSLLKEGNFAGTGISSVTLPNTVTSIGVNLFYNCTLLTSINIPDSVTSIGTNAFYNTSSNLTVTIKQQQTINGNLTTFTGTNQSFFGNTSVDFVLPPLTMTISATASGSPLASGSTTKNTPIVLTFTSSASTADFGEDDISLTNGSLNSSFAASSGTDGKVYNATFTPNGQGICTINVPANKFTSGGLNNIASNTFTFTFDAAPTMTITSTIANNATSNNASIPLTFTASEAITEFDVQDISFNKGSLTDLSGSGTVYTAIFTQGGQGAHIINVPVGAYIDASGNANTAAASFTWTYDSVTPGMIITSTTSGVTSGSTTNNASIALTFTATASTSDFVLGDISFTNGANGTLSDFAGSGTIYTATFTPADQGLCTINVPGGAFTYADGNSNTASNTFTWTYDSISPSMDISSNDVANGSTTNKAIALTFTSTEATNNFAVEDITVTNGSLNSSFTAVSSTVYTAIFTPTNQGLCTIDVSAGVYTDAATNLNNLATQFSFTYDTVVPTMLIESTTIGVSSGSTTNNASIALRFTSSKPTSNFAVGDISVTNGSLNNSFASSSPTVYTATFTPAGQGACTIDVSGGVFTDAAGNNNAAATQFTWTYDRDTPGMTITSTTSGVTSGSTTNNATIALTFTASASTSDFTVDDITVTNGTLSSPLGGSGSVYTATFTPTNQGLCTIDVSSNKFTYAAGNSNNAATQFTWTFDSFSPTMLIESTTAGVTNGSTTNQAITLRFTSSEATTNFAVGDISVTNGTLSNFAASSSTVYTATFTPTSQGTCTINVAAGAYTDAVGNNNSATTFSVGYIPNFALFNNANNLEQTYITGFLDVSGNVNHRTGDLNVMDGNVVVHAGNANFNSGNLYVGGNVSVNSNMAVVGTTTLTSLVARDNLDVSGASTLGGSLTVAGITSLNNHVSIANNKPFTVGTGKATFGGDVSLNSNLVVDNGVSLKSSVDVSGSAVFANTAVNGALLFNTRPSFASDISLNAPNIDICGNLYAQYAANSIPASAIVGGAGNVIEADVSMNAGLNIAGATTLSAVTTSGDATIGGTLNIIGASTMSTLSISNATTIGGPLNVVGITTFSNDVSFNGSRIDICGNLYAKYPENSIPSSALMGGGSSTYNTDVSMNAGLFVSNAVNLGSTLVVSGKTALRGDISLGTVNGSRIDICGNLYANYASNSIPQSAIVGGVGSLFTTDVSMNAGLYVKNGITLDTITMQYQQTPSVGLYVNAVLNATTLSSSGSATINTLTVTGTTALSSTLNVTGAATLGSTLSVAGATTAGALTTSGASTMSGTLNVSGISTFNAAATWRSTLAVVGATTLKSTLTVVGATTMNSGLSVVGATTMNTTLSGVGATTLTAVNAMNILNISGASTFGSTLAVTGATTLASLLTVVGTSRFKGDYTMNSTLNVLGDVSLNSTLNVTSATTLAALTVERSTTVGGTLRVNQTAPFTLDVITSNTLTVASDVSMNTRLSVGGATSFRSTLAVAGATTLAALTTTGNTIIGDGLVVSGVTTFSQDASLNVTSVDISGVVNAGQLTIGQTTLQYKPELLKLGGDIDGEDSENYFGQSVALSADGSIVAIGANGNDGSNVAGPDNRGHVKVYQRNVTNTSIAPIGWTQLGGNIVGEAATDQSGASVSLISDGTNIIVAISSLLNDGTTTNTDDNRGHVRVYQYVQNKAADTNQSSSNFGPAGWKRLGADIDGEASADNSGSSVALAGNWPNIIVAIGANSNDGTTTNTSDIRGHVRVYQYVEDKLAETNQGSSNFGPAGWKRLGQDIDGETAGDGSGQSVSLSADGTIVAIGGYNNDGTTTSTTDIRGHVRIYKYELVQANIWSQLGGDIDGEAAGDQSGQSVSLSADGYTVAIGANSNDGTTTNAGDIRGHVRVYTYGLLQPNIWSQLGGDIDGEAATDQSGLSISLSADGSIVAVGAWKNDGIPGVDRGHIRIYKYDASKFTAVTNQSLSNFGPVGWTRLGADIDGEAASDQFGRSVSLSANGTIVAIGANFNDGLPVSADRGSVRVYQVVANAGLYTDASLNVPSIVTTGYASVGGNLSVTGATTMSNTLFVTGASTFASLSSNNGTTIAGTLNVNGATTVGSTLHVNGATTATALTTNSNATVGGILNVADATTMGSLNFTGQLLQW